MRYFSSLLGLLKIRLSVANSLPLTIDDNDKFVISECKHVQDVVGNEMLVVSTGELARKLVFSKYFT